MQTAKKYNEFIVENNKQLDEGRASQILASLGKHAAAAIIAYLAQNPEVISNVIDGLKGSDNREVKSQISKI